MPPPVGGGILLGYRKIYRKDRPARLSRAALSQGAVVLLVHFKRGSDKSHNRERVHIPDKGICNPAVPQGVPAHVGHVIGAHIAHGVDRPRQ